MDLSQSCSARDLRMTEFRDILPILTCAVEVLRAS
jgi:hypothetical protein